MTVGAVVSTTVTVCVAVAELAEITMESIRGVHKIGAGVTKVKLVGASAKDLASKIKDENVTTTGN